MSAVAATVTAAAIATAPAASTAAASTATASPTIAAPVTTAMRTTATVWRAFAVEVRLTSWFVGKIPTALDHERSGCLRFAFRSWRRHLGLRATTAAAGCHFGALLF